MEFPVTSPVARFLTGLELLHDKMEDWNKTAHKGNNLNDLSTAVRKQIVEWRKLELNSWRESLNNVFER
jgi:midasin